MDLTIGGDDSTIHTVRSFVEEFNIALSPVTCHVCRHVMTNHTIDDYCCVCCSPTHIDTTCHSCPGNVNRCAMVVACCDDHMLFVCVQCLGARSIIQILGVYRNTLQRAGITRHPNALPLGDPPIPITVEVDDSEAGGSTD